MAFLYLGRLTDADRRVVALKVIRPEYARDIQFVAMFLDEAKLTSRLDHPSIVEIYEQAIQDGNLFIAMELLLGQSLATVWRASEERGRRLPAEVVAFLGARVSDGLHHAHELKDERAVPQHVVHRDINPSNIFLTYSGHVKVVDFGLAKAVDRLTTTMAGVVKGKLAYMAPEQIAGSEIDRRADIFALGVTLWELTVGRRLFKAAHDADTMKNVRDAKVPDPRSIIDSYPPALAQIVMRSLARDREARYRTAADMAKDLDAYVLAGRRIVNPATLVEIMTALFPDERDRDASWFEGRELPIRTVPLAPISLPSKQFESNLLPRQAELGQPYADELEPTEPGTLPATPGSFEIDVDSQRYPVDRATFSVKPSAWSLSRRQRWPLARLSRGDIAVFAALTILVVTAIATAVCVSLR
jgi:serine/threonine-protein kinase